MMENLRLNRFDCDQNQLNNFFITFALLIFLIRIFDYILR